MDGLGDPFFASSSLALNHDAYVTLGNSLRVDYCSLECRATEEQGSQLPEMRLMVLGVGLERSDDPDPFTESQYVSNAQGGVLHLLTVDMNSVATAEIVDNPFRTDAQQLSMVS
jgi:hypothetical protein